MLLFIDTSQIILIVLLGLMLVMYPVFMYSRNKKEKEFKAKLSDNLKKGAHVVTFSGIVGKVVEIEQRETGKFVTIQTGEGKFSGYVCVAVEAIGNVFDPNIQTINGKSPENVSENVPAEANIAESKSEVKGSYVKKKAPAKTSTKATQNKETKK